MKPKKILCRVCLQCDFDNDDVSSIFKESEKGFIFEKLNTIAEVHIKPEDGLPDQICSDCLLELENAINFKQKCETSNSILLAMNTGIGPTQDDEDPLDTVKSEPEECVDQKYFEEDVWSPAEAPIKSDPDPQLEDTGSHTPPDKKSKAIDLQLECHDCGGSFKSKCKLKVHWKNVHLKEQLTCPICRKTFGSFKTRKEHDINNTRRCRTFSQVNVTGEGKNRMLHCRECDYSNSSISNMASHLVKHTQEHSYGCKLCSKCFKKFAGLQIHMEAEHGIIKQRLCKICGKLITGKQKYEIHLRWHRNLDRFVTCEVCQKTMKKNSLKAHILSVHSNVRSYACDKCAATFKTSSNLWLHTHRVHQVTEHLKCDKCEFRAKYASSMKRHQSKHTGNDFPCTVCGKFFENQVQLTLHEERHTNRDHKCSECDSTFFRRKGLLCHINKRHRIYLA